MEQQNIENYASFTFSKWYDNMKSHTLKSEVVSVDTEILKHYFFKDGMQQPEKMFEVVDDEASDEEAEPKEDVV
jgi:hypothetical protein